MSRNVPVRDEIAASGSPAPEAAPGEASIAPVANPPPRPPVLPRRERANARAVSLFRALNALIAREKDHLVSEILKVRGLMPLLMKPRNGQRWTGEDKAELVTHLRRLSKLSPYLVIGVMPGGFLLLPALAWWLDRRRNRTASRRSTEPKP